MLLAEGVFVRTSRDMTVSDRPSNEDMSVRAIGVVRNGVSEPRTVWEEVESEIVLEDRYVPDLAGLQEFSHVIVLFWLHLSSPWEPDTFRGPSDDGRRGTFATRSPVRPNPIGVTVVELKGIEGCTVRVHGLDAVDGTQVLDIKPYIHYGDRVEEPREPDWCRDFNENKRYLDSIPMERGGRQRGGSE